MEIRTLIEDYLHEAKLMQVATAQNNLPWACTVYFAFDTDLNLYWISTPERRHSLDIESNPQVAGTIVLPHTPGSPVRGLQFEGRAEALRQQSASAFGMERYATRYDMDKQRVKDVVEGSDGHICYKIAPRKYVLFDELNFPRDPRQEYII